MYSKQTLVSRVWIGVLKQGKFSSKQCYFSEKTNVFPLFQHSYPNALEIANRSLQVSQLVACFDKNMETRTTIWYLRKLPI